MLCPKSLRLVGGLMVLGLLLWSARVEAVTVQDLVQLSRAGVSDTVLLALIERDQTIFAMDAARVITLQQDGISEPVLLAMLRSGRPDRPPASSQTQAGDQPGSQVSASSASGPSDQVPFPEIAPNVVVIGASPAVPKAREVSVLIPYPLYFTLPPERGGHRRTLPGRVEDPQAFRGFGRFINDGYLPPADADRR